MKILTSVKKAVKGTRAPKSQPSKTVADPYLADLFDKIAEGKTTLQLGKDEKVFSQGDTAEAIYFVQAGKVKITVVSAAGHEAVLTILGPCFSAHFFEPDRNLIEGILDQM